MVHIKTLAMNILPSSYKVPSAKAESYSNLIGGVLRINSYIERCLIIESKALKERQHSWFVLCIVLFLSRASNTCVFLSFFLVRIIFYKYLHKTVGL